MSNNHEGGPSDRTAAKILFALGVGAAAAAGAGLAMDKFQGYDSLEQANSCYHALQDSNPASIKKQCLNNFDGIPKGSLTVKLPEGHGSFLMVPTPEGYRAMN